jgi:carbonic anhydrase
VSGLQNLEAFEKEQLQVASINLGQSLEVQIANPGSVQNKPSIRIGGSSGPQGQTFMPTRLIFHAFASEHTVDGGLYALEAQLLMQSVQNPRSQLAAIAVLYELGEQGDPFIDQLLNELPAKRNESLYGQTLPVDLSFSLTEDILPASRKYVGYDGSLTTPPCSEIVKWHVFLQPRTVTVEQLSFLGEITLGSDRDGSGRRPVVTNNRLVQPLNGRPLYAYTPEASACIDCNACIDQVYEQVRGPRLFKSERLGVGHLRVCSEYS